MGLFLIDARSLFQGQQRKSAEGAARANGVELEVAFAEGESRKQRDQIFACLRRETPPQAVIVEPVEDTGLRFVAQEALRKGVAWVMINRSLAWVADVARESKGTAFCVTADQEGIGRVQGEQFRALLPSGGSVLYIQGPPAAEVVIQRLRGMEETKGGALSVTKLVGAWTEKSGYDAVRTWLETTRGFVEFDLVGAQNDDMAYGGRKAVVEMAAAYDKPAWREIPAAGVDGMAEFGIRLVDEKTLAATVIMPTTTGKAVEIMATVLKGGAPPPPVTTVPVMSHPHLSLLRARR
jgi:ribose transport system substrate-binding protein